MTEPTLCDSCANRTDECKLKAITCWRYLKKEAAHGEDGKG